MAYLLNKIIIHAGGFSSMGLGNDISGWNGGDRVGMPSVEEFKVGGWLAGLHLLQTKVNGWSSGCQS